MVARHSFFHSFKIFIEFLLHARHDVNKTDNNSCPCGAYILEEEIENKNIECVGR